MKHTPPPRLPGGRGPTSASAKPHVALAPIAGPANTPASRGHRGEVEGLLSGSDAATQKRVELAPALEASVEQAATDAVVVGLVAAMILNAVVAAIGVGIGLLYRKPKSDEATETATTPSA